MKRIISTWIVLFVTWIALAGFSVEELLVGLAVTLAIALLLGKSGAYDFGLNIITASFKFIFVYLPYFIYKLIEANIDLAKIVLNPNLPINPGFVKISTGLDGDMAKLILANSITLTPGTLTIDIEGNDLLIHWVNVQGEDKNDHFKLIASGFEKKLGGIVE